MADKVEAHQQEFQKRERLTRRRGAGRFKTRTTPLYQSKAARPRLSSTQIRFVTVVRTFRRQATGDISGRASVRFPKP